MQALGTRLSPNVIALQSLRMEKADDDAAAAAAKEQEEKDAAAAAEAEKNKPKPGSAEERVQKALEKASAAEARAEAAEKKAEDARIAEEARKTKELEEKGEFKTLAEQHKEEARKAKEDLDKANGELTTARQEAESEVQAEIEKITDEKKRETVKELLAGKTPFEQRRLLPKVLEMAGISASGRVGAGLPGSGTTGGTIIEEKEKEYRDLYAKSQKGDITPSEKLKLQTLGRDLSRLRSEAKKAKSDDSDDEVTLH